MIVFTPYTAFHQCVGCLDRGRLWKQILECRMMISEIELHLKTGSKPTRLLNHPGVKCWIPYVSSLKYYFNLALGEWRSRGYKSEYPYYNDYSNELPDFMLRKEYIDAMRSRLIAKYSDYYLKMFRSEENYNGGEYWYPTMIDGKRNYYRAKDKLLLISDDEVPEVGKEYLLVYPYSTRVARGRILSEDENAYKVLFLKSGKESYISKHTAEPYSIKFKDTNKKLYK